MVLGFSQIPVEVKSQGSLEIVRNRYYPIVLILKLRRAAPEVTPWEMTAMDLKDYFEKQPASLNREIDTKIYMSRFG